MVGDNSRPTSLILTNFSRFHRISQFLLVIFIYKVVLLFLFTFVNVCILQFQDTSRGTPKVRSEIQNQLITKHDHISYVNKKRILNDNENETVRKKNKERYAQNNRLQTQEEKEELRKNWREKYAKKKVTAQ